MCVCVRACVVYRVSSLIRNSTPPGPPLERRKTLVSLNLRLKDLLEPVTRVKKKKRGGGDKRLFLQGHAALDERGTPAQGYLAHEKTPSPRTLR